MAKSRVNRGAKAWNEARERYQQLQAYFDGMGSETPFDIQEDTEIAIEQARRDFLALNAPHLDGVCERIILFWDEKLFDEEDYEMEMLRRIVGNLRQLALKLN